LSMKKVFIGIPVAIISTIPWILIGLGIALSPTPPKPKNTYGEFPFHLVYEVDGEQFTIDDVIVCEFIGRGANEGSGKFLKWDMRLLSGNDYGRLAQTRQSIAVVKLLDDVIMHNYVGHIYYDLGTPQYYLGYNAIDGYSPCKVFNAASEIFEADDLWNRYKIRIIEAIFSKPMVGNGIAIKN